MDSRPIDFRSPDSLNPQVGSAWKNELVVSRTTVRPSVSDEGPDAGPRKEQHGTDPRARRELAGPSIQSSRRAMSNAYGVPSRPSHPGDAESLGSEVFAENGAEAIDEYIRLSVTAEHFLEVIVLRCATCPQRWTTSTSAAIMARCRACS